MKRSIGLWQLCGYAVTVLGGTLLHFLYDFTNQSLLAAPFSGVNESTWEHMKLLFWPMLLFALVEHRFFPERKNFFCIKLRGTLLGLALIPLLFYGYNGIVGPSPDGINIAIFFISAALAYLYETKKFKDDSVRCPFPRLPLLALVFLAALFVIFTFYTPEIPLFKDPLTGGYGI